MAVELAGLLVVNIGYAVVGGAAFAVGGWVRLGEPATWRRLGAAYLFGIALLVVPASYVALLGVPVGATASVVGFGVVGLAAFRARPFRRPRLPRLRLSAGAVAGVAVTAVGLFVLAYSARTFATRPLVDFDAWAIWAAKARLLYQDPTLAPGVLRGGLYGQTPYPLGFPTLQALGYGAMGRFDGTLIGVQLLGLAFGFVGALWSVLDRRARPLAIGLAAVAVVVAPQILYQLLTHYADVPLGLFVGVGVAAAAAWTLRPDHDNWLLACSVAFLAMAGLTKSEGSLFALAGAVALLLAQAGPDWRERIRPALVAVAALAAALLPWRIYTSAYNLTTPDYDLKNATNVTYLRAHDDRLGPVLHELWRQLDAPSKWGYLVLALALGLATSLLGRRWRLSVFAVVWLGLAFCGLVLVYWLSTLPTSNNLTNSSYRTIVSLLVGGTAMLPF